MPANESRFLRQIKVSIKHYNIVRFNKYPVCDLLYDVINNACPARKVAICVT